MKRKIVYLAAFLGLIFTSCEDRRVENKFKSTEKQQTAKSIRSNVDTVASSNKEFGDTVYNILQAFKNKNQESLNELVSKEYGVIILFRTGVFNEYKHLDKIDFSDPSLQSLSPSADIRDLILKYENLPKFNCGTMEWDKYGLFCDTINKDTLISGTPQNLIKYRGDKIAVSEVKKLKDLEAQSRRVVFAHPGQGFIFYLTLFDGKWYLTAIDRVTTDCSA